MRVGTWWSAESLLRGQGCLIGRRPPSPLPRVDSACIRKNGTFRPTPATKKLPAPPKTGRDSAHATPTSTNLHRRFHADEFLHTTGFPCEWNGGRSGQRLPSAGGLVGGGDSNRWALCSRFVESSYTTICRSMPSSARISRAAFSITASSVDVY